MDIQIGMPCKYDLICELLGYGVAIFIIFLLFAAGFALVSKPKSKPNKARPDKSSGKFIDMEK